MRSFWTTTLALALAGLALVAPAKAQDFNGFSGNESTPRVFHIFDEVRTGGSFSVQPNDDSGFIVRGEVITGQFFRRTDNYVANTLFNPRAHLGANFATAKDGVSQVYGGLTWDFPVFDPFFIEATFGFTVHNGPLESSGDGLDLGCRVLFRESLGVGVDLGKHWRVLAAADHSSHAHRLCSNEAGNSGITHVGAYVGYRF